MVAVYLPKILRIWLHARPLNKVIEIPYYPIITTYVLTTKLQDCKNFTVLDRKKSFGQLPMDEESSYLTTFSTPWRRFRFLVLSFA